MTPALIRCAVPGVCQLGSRLLAGDPSDWKPGVGDGIQTCRVQLGRSITDYKYNKIAFTASLECDTRTPYFQWFAPLLPNWSKNGAKIHLEGPSEQSGGYAATERSISSERTRRCECGCSSVRDR